jgi:hypothetical protein
MSLEQEEKLPMIVRHAPENLAFTQKIVSKDTIL